MIEQTRDPTLCFQRPRFQMLAHHLDELSS